jgi:hypothetical protein
MSVDRKTLKHSSWRATNPQHGFGKTVCWNLSGDAMFTLFRYGLLPVVFYCIVVITAGVDAFLTNTVRKANWPQTVVTVVQSQDFGDVAAAFRGTPNTFPDPRGKLNYVIDGKSYDWQGRGRDIGVTVMKPGDQIKVYYNPRDPRDISTLVLLGASTGSIIMAVALAFLAFYFWFFWLRGFLRRSGPDDFNGDVAGSFADHAQEHPNAIIKRPMGKSFDQGLGATTFGKR